MTEPRIAPHGRGGPNDDILGQKIIGIHVVTDCPWLNDDKVKSLIITLENGMDIYIGDNELRVMDAGAEYSLNKWKESK